MRTDVIIACTSKLYGIDGLNLSNKVSKLIKKDFLKKIQSLENSKHLAFSVTSNLDLSENDVLIVFNFCWSYH